MSVLGLDTSTPATVVGLLLSDGTLLEAHDHREADERPAHQDRLLPLAAGLLARAGQGWERLDRVAVGLGPGGYTGLRVSVATARALAQALSLELVGVSSPLVLASAALRRWPAPEGGAESPHHLLTVTDARRGEVFVAAYAGVPRPPDRGAAQPAVVAAPRALARERLVELAAGLGADARWLAVGNAAGTMRAELEALGIGVPPAGSELHRLRGGALCELAAQLPAARPQEVLPDYCRRPDAEIALEARGAKAPPRLAGVAS